MFYRKLCINRELPARLEIPKPRKALRNFSWLSNDKLAQRYIIHEAELLQFDPGAVITNEEDDYKVKGLNALTVELLLTFITFDQLRLILEFERKVKAEIFRIEQLSVSFTLNISFFFQVNNGGGGLHCPNVTL